MNFGVDPLTGSIEKVQSTSAFASNAPAPGVLREKSTSDGLILGDDQTRARVSAASRAVARASGPVLAGSALAG